VARHTTGFDAVAALARPWSPERTAEVTRIPAATLREVVRAYREADGAALYGSTGMNMGTNGSLAFWLQEVINAVSGNLDRRGGTLVGRGIVDFARFGKRTGVMMKRHQSRLGGFTSVNDAFPGGMLADEILTPGPRQVRALFVTGGNPLITMPNAARLRDAFRDLELLVCVDVFLNETASLADYVLPATAPLQRPDLPFVFPLLLGMQSRPYLQATTAVVPPDGEQRDESTIYLDLARACGTGLFGSTAARRAVELLARLHHRLHPDRGPGVPVAQRRRIFDTFQRGDRDTVDPGGAPVCPHQGPGVMQDIRPVDLVVEEVKPEGRLLLGLAVQRPLECAHRLWRFQPHGNPPGASP